MYARKLVETPRSDQFNIKKVGIQTNKPLNWHHGGCTCIDLICLDRRFIPMATKEPFTKMLKCLTRSNLTLGFLPTFYFLMDGELYLFIIRNMNLNSESLIPRLLTCSESLNSAL